MEEQSKLEVLSVLQSGVMINVGVFSMKFAVYTRSASTACKCVNLPESIRVSQHVPAVKILAVFDGVIVAQLFGYLGVALSHLLLRFV